MPSFVLRWLPLTVILIAAFGLRTWDLGRRPMHADEANQAVKAGLLLETGRYAFDPADHHGPTLYYAVLPLAWLRGQTTLAELSESTVRLVPALAGTLAVLLLYFLARPLGPWPALAASAFLALSPAAVYYSRYFIQETLLVCFTLGALVCARRWWHGGRLGWAIGAGLGAGLMQATKASAPLIVIAALGGLLLARPSRAAATRVGRDLAAALAAAFLIAALFYTSFGTHLRGLADAVGTYPAMAARISAGTGHEKPWWYYLQLLGWQHHGGLAFQQVALTALALAGLVVALGSRHRVLLRWAAGSTVILTVVLSATAYKTPWQILQLGPGLALLAAGALAALPARAGGRILATGLGLVVLAALIPQVRLTSFLRPADERNPYAYVHTAPDVLKVRPLVESARLSAPGQPVRIISEEAWPLPWYLRGLPDIGYWTQVPADCDGALVIASATLAEAVQTRLHGTYTSQYIGLRPGFVLVVFRPAP